MISVKGGTKVWSDAPQQSSLKSDPTQMMSTTTKEEQFGGQEVGDILNKISDPNWVDPSKKVRQVGNNKLDKDAFLNLLLAQMKNQDPTNPLKSHEMAAQLAQFTSLEKLSAIDAGIEKLTKAQTPNSNFEALNFIGKMVAGDGAKIQRMDEADGHDIKFHLANDAQTAKLDIKNEEGEVVRSLTVNTLKSGKNEIYWNGQLENGTPARTGEYTVEISATGSNGAKLHAETQFQGKVTGVNFTSAGPVLMVGKQPISMREVTEIVDPGSAAAGQPIRAPQLAGKQVDISSMLAAAGVQQAPPSGEGSGEQPIVAQPTQAPTAAPQAPVVPLTPKVQDGNAKKAGSPMKSNLENVPMARGLMNNLSKEGAETGM